MVKRAKPDSPGFFHTLPGLLTALAALITAVAGLIAVFVSMRHDRDPQPTQSASLAPESATLGGSSHAASLQVAATPPKPTPEFAVPNADLFCSRLKDVVREAGNGFEGIKREKSEILDSWEVGIRLPNSEWCALHTMPALMSDRSHLYYSCKLFRTTAKDVAASRHEAYLAHVSSCLGSDWIAESFENEDDPTLPGDSDFNQDGNTVHIEVEFDLDGEKGESMLYVHER